MRFHLIDRILAVAPGERISAVKNLTLGEEYLADHFPTFPVMPGVLMLEAMVQAGAWLVRCTDRFRHSMIVLREVKGVKYGSFVEPGKQIALNVEISGRYDPEAKSLALKGNGEVDGVTTVTARLVLDRYNLAERDPALAPIDRELLNHYRGLFATLRPKDCPMPEVAG